MILQQKVYHFIRLLWAAVALFCLVGFFLQRQEAVIVVVITALMWATTRIIVEGMDSFAALVHKPPKDDAPSGK